jgi:hypothetical protein
MSENRAVGDAVRKKLSALPGESQASRAQRKPIMFSSLVSGETRYR